MKKLTKQDVREFLDYNPETGEFLWIKASSNRSPAGSRAGTRLLEGYIAIKVLGKLMLAHRLAFLWMEGWIPKEVDHINCDRADNRWANLRPCSRSQNNRNSGLHRNNKTGSKGLWRNATSWYVDVYLNGSRSRFGPFKQKEEAIRARVIFLEKAACPFTRHD